MRNCMHSPNELFLMHARVSINIHTPIFPPSHNYDLEQMHHTQFIIQSLVVKSSKWNSYLLRPQSIPQAEDSRRIVIGHKALTSRSWVNSFPNLYNLITIKTPNGLLIGLVFFFFPDPERLNFLLNHYLLCPHLPQPPSKRGAKQKRTPRKRKKVLGS